MPVGPVTGETVSYPLMSSVAANTQAPEEALTADETSQQRQIVKFDLMGPIDLQMKAMSK